MQEKINDKLRKYLASNKLLCLGVRDEVGVYVSNAFYAFDEDDLALIIASHADTKHIKLAAKDGNVGVNVATMGSLAKLKGVQIKALLQKASVEQERLYYATFPFAKVRNAECYALRILYAKFTDNSLLTHKKIEFVREL